MLRVAANSAPICVSSPSVSPRNRNYNPRVCFLRKFSSPSVSGYHRKSFSLLSTFFTHFSFSLHIDSRSQSHFSFNAYNSSSAPVGSKEYVEDPATNVKFQTSLSLPGCSNSLSLLGTGYREKVFAIIGVKVYAAGLYANKSVLNELSAFNGRSASEIENDSSLFNSIFKSRLEKSLQIVLVRDVDGKTFWDALDDAISLRIKTPGPVDESAVSTFRSIFEGRALKKGTFIFLTWLDPSKMLVSISTDGLPTGVDATIESENVTFALFDVFLGETPVSPSLKASVANGVANILNRLST